MRINTKNVFAVSLLIFIALLFVVPTGLITTDLGNTLITVIAFLFGIIAGFYIVVTTIDYNSVKNILASETAGWISLYQTLRVYDLTRAEKICGLIDSYILKAFDYEIIDYERGTRNEFESIKKFIEEVPVKKDESFLYEKVRDKFDGIVASRQQMAVLGIRTLSLFQWVILVTLATLFIFCLYGLRTGEIFFDIVTVAISSSIILILLLIRELDLYIWNEKTFGYDIFENVLISVGRLPYYPIESLIKGRVHPSEKEYRVGILVDYPRSMERKIDIRKN